MEQIILAIINNRAQIAKYTPAVIDGLVKYGPTAIALVAKYGPGTVELAKTYGPTIEKEVAAATKTLDGLISQGVDPIDALKKLASSMAIDYVVGALNPFRMSPENEAAWSNNKSSISEDRTATSA